MAGYDDWKSREPDPWAFEHRIDDSFHELEGPLVNDYEPGSQWRQRLLWHDEPEPTSRKLLRQIQHAGGLDPDGPRLVPMQAPLSREDTRRAVQRAGEVAMRDAMLRRAVRVLGLL